MEGSKGGADFKVDESNVKEFTKSFLQDVANVSKMYRLNEPISDTEASVIVMPDGHLEENKLYKNLMTIKRLSDQGIGRTIFELPMEYVDAETDSTGYMSRGVLLPSMEKLNELKQRGIISLHEYNMVVGILGTGITALSEIYRGEPITERRKQSIMYAIYIADAFGLTAEAKAMANAFRARMVMS